MITRWPVQFRVYAGSVDHRGLFVYARVFRTRRDMLATLRTEGHFLPSGTQGLMDSYTVRRYNDHNRYARTVPCVGCVNLHQGRLGIETISHEFTHAMFAWAERKRLLGQVHPTRDTQAALDVEEEFCYTLGRFCRRFIARARELGLDL